MIHLQKLKGEKFDHSITLNVHFCTNLNIFCPKIVGYTDLPSRLPTQSSTLYANNLKNYLFSMGEKGKGEFAIDLNDEVVRGSIVLQDGESMWPPPAVDLPLPSPPKPKAIVKPPEQSPFSAAAWETGLTTGT